MQGGLIKVRVGQPVNKVHGGKDGSVSYQPAVTEARIKNAKFWRDDIC